jgi:energy-coupling factor transport system ATP-binding protein
LGKNGAQKTTLARLLTGLSRLDEGQLRIGNDSIRPRKLLKRASIVLQNTDHQLHMKTVREEVKVSARPSQCAQSDQLIDALLSRFRLMQLAGRHPQSLSGGEKQRLVMVCALVKQPDILILDEPTSGLDGQNMQLISESIRMTADRGACVVLITHDLELISSACDYVLNLPIDADNREETDNVRHIPD